MNDKKCIAITGCSGSGKTTIIEYLKSIGYYTFDSDNFVHDLFSHSNVKERIQSQIKNNVYQNDKIDYQRVQLYFDSHKDEEENFFNWFHVYVGKQLELKIKSFSSSPVFVDAPFIEERKIEPLFYQIWIVHTDYDICFKRIKKRNPSYSIDKISNIIKNTSVSTNLLNKSDFIIFNNSRFNNLKMQLDEKLKMFI